MKGKNNFKVQTDIQVRSFDDETNLPLDIHLGGFYANLQTDLTIFTWFTLDLTLLEVSVLNNYTRFSLR